MSTRYLGHSMKLMLLKVDSHPTVFVSIHFSTTPNMLIAHIIQFLEVVTGGVL